MRGGIGEEIEEVDTASQQTKVRERQVRVERKCKRKRRNVMGETRTRAEDGETRRKWRNKWETRKKG